MRKLHDSAHILLSVILILSFGLAPIQGAIQPAQAAQAAPLAQPGADEATPTPTSLPVETATPTATPTPAFLETAVPATPEATLGPRPSATPTLFETPFPTEPAPTILPAPTEISLPTATSTALPSTPDMTDTPVSPTATPTETPTATPIATNDTSQVITATLAANLPAYLPGEEICLFWLIETAADLAQEKLELAISAPPALAPTDDSLGYYDRATNTVTLPIETPDGLYCYQTPADLRGQIQLQAILSGAEQAEKVYKLAIPEEGWSELPEGAGEAIGLNGQVRVIFPQEGAATPLGVRVRRPVKASAPPFSLSEKPFEIIAEDLNTRTELHHFAVPLTIEVAYHGSRDAAIFYYDPESANWQALPTEYDREAGVLRAQSDHLSIFDSDINEWQAANMPSLDSAQVASQTGSASYSYPIWTPPGPAGLQPGLALTYSSQMVDGSIASLTQAGWVGMGWSLDTGYVERNMHGTMFGEGDDTFSVVVNGVSSMILKDSSGNYRMADENFWKVTYSSDTWTIWDKSGNQYVFGNSANTRATYPRFYPQSCTTPVSYMTYRWGIAQQTNIHGKTITYTYEEDTKQVDGPCPSGDDNKTAEIALYLKRITYPNNRYLIEFFRSNDVRQDYKSNWVTNSATIFFHKDRLDRIEIQHDADGTGSGAPALVKKYQITYGATLFPGYTWSGGGQTFSISRLQEFDAAGASLPATDFSYDGIRLVEVDNGYGASAAFDYEDTPWSDVNTQEDWDYTVQSSDCPGNWTGGISCVGDKLYVSGTAYLGFGDGAVQPGGVYELFVDLRHITQGDPKTATVKLQYGDSETLDVIQILSQSIPSYTNATTTQTITLPTNAKRLRWVITANGVRIVNLVARLMPTHYRLTGITQSGANIEANQTTTYTYDDPGMNDAEHSAAVQSGAGLYSPAYSQFRGNAMTRAVSPADEADQRRVTTTWFSQSDEHQGKTVASLVGTRQFGESFLNPDIAAYSANWTIPDPNPSLSIGRKSGDNALKVAYLSPAWGGAIQRQGNSVSNNESILLHFRLEGANVGSILAAEASNGYRWEIYLQGTAGVFTAQARYTSATQVISFANLTGLDNIQQNTWYVLLLVMDNDRLYLRAWQRDDPAKFADHQLNGLPAGISNGQTWHFRSWTNNGTTWIDEYLEGQTYQLSFSEYGAESFPVHPDHGGYADLNIRWTYPTRETRMSFEGDGTWNATRASYEYLETEQGGINHQYGNLTRTLHASWDAAQSAWRDYRLTITGYYPAPSPNNLVGLPGFSNQYACPSGLFNGACSANYPTYPPANMLAASTAYVYDSNTNWYTPPSAGKLTWERQFLRFATPANYTDPKYRDVKYEYDSWGNPYRVTTWTGEGTYSAFASTGAQVTTSCYGSGAPPICTDDGYGVYKAWERNALNQDTTYAYNKALGVLTEETGPNGSTTKTTAGYDGFGRIIRVVRPGDTDPSPTIAIVYGDSAAPFYTEASQKIQGSTLYKLRKYYNGLGQLLQTQVIGATVGGAVKDIRTDTFYDALGQVTKQTVPYATTTGGYFSDRSESEAFTHTSYDVLGRATLVTAPDGADTTYTYLDLETRVTDDLNNTTSNLMDIWGRTLVVDPPAGPSVAYTYDALDRLLTANYGGAVTSLSYDYAGRKLTMTDPDMGAWSYAYDALGNLTRQKDARNQRICFYYDALNRLTGKHYRTDDSCPASPTLNVTYTYDGGTYGKGQRTGMSDPSGSTAWTYDARGRMLTESKTISGTGGGTFLTQWQYNSADQITSMTYPGNASGSAGETVSYDYLPQMTLNSVSGSATYVPETVYDAAGRVDLRKLGGTAGSPILQTDYIFFSWITPNGAGRLKRIVSGTPAVIDLLQDLRYYTSPDTSSYDANGNLLNIYDYKAGGMQTQTFTYDALNRLKSAAASEGTGGIYSESYTYDGNTGNLSIKAGVNYTYGAQSASCPGGALSKPHAVVTAGTNTYCYDPNGNQVRRTIAGSVYNLIYDAENRLSSVSGAATAGFVYDGDGKRVKETNAYKNLAQGIVVSGSVAIINPDVITNGDTQADNGAGTSREYGYSSANGLQYVEIDLGALFPVNKVSVWHYNGGTRTYHNTKTQVSADRVTWTTVFDSAVSGEYVETLAGKTHTFTQRSVRYVRDYLNGSTSNSGNHWTEIEVWGTATTAYVGDYFEWNGSPQTMTRYYSAGGTRVAVRNSNGNGTDGLVYLLGDHLGSASLTADPLDGDKLSELRYKAWGETRHSLTNAPTDRRYTGQTEEAGIGLYYYGARFYDPLLARWASPDSIIPQNQGVLAWDRYAYVNNSPLNYTDPTGHDLEQIIFNKTGALPKSQQPTYLQSSRKNPQPTLPPRGLVIPNNNYSTPQDYSGYSDPYLDAWFSFWNDLASPFFDSVEAYDFYQLTSKGGWRALRYAVPTGLVEAGVAGFRRYYRDTWYQSLSPEQRIGRVLVTAGETYATDILAGLAGSGLGSLGASAFGPLGAFTGYIAGNAIVTAAGDRAWARFNQDYLSPYLGVFP